MEHLLKAQVFIMALLVNWAPLVSFDYMPILPLVHQFK